MDDNLAQLAINAALCCDWKDAILHNLKILKLDNENIDALNRIARAYAESGEIAKAKKATLQVLKLDPNNHIAKKCLLRWKTLKKVDGSRPNVALYHSAFIEEPRKTKIVNLINLGDAKNIASLDCGDAVKLVSHSHRVSIMTTDDKYIGRFSDDLAAKFIRLIKTGNSYETFIKSADNTQVRVFIQARAKSVL